MLLQGEIISQSHPKKLELKYLKQKSIYHALHPENYTNSQTSRQQAHHLGKITISFCQSPIHNYSHEIYRDRDLHGIAHCLHMLREGIMCQADTTLVTMRWNPKRLIPNGNFSSPHACVNWDLLMKWVKQHAFDAFADGVLVHPEFGKYILMSTPFFIEPYGLTRMR
jgi:hypothetical protein